MSIGLIPPRPSPHELIVNILYTLPIGLLFILIVETSWLRIINGHTIVYVNLSLLVLHRTFPISAITKIELAPMYIVLSNTVQVLRIWYNEADERKYIDLQIALYGDKETFVPLVRELLRINPEIKLDAKVQRMLKKYANV